jgi:tetratricopeptide (TPR) repeat protein
MSLTQAKLTKLAIKSAYSQDWEKAVEFNSQILEQDNKNLDALLRISFAYLQLQDYNKARKFYKEVLDIDPINTIALEKMKLVKERKTEEFIIPDSESLLKESGTSIEITTDILTKGITSDKFKFDEDLLFKINGKTISIHKDDIKQSLINYLPEQYVKYFLKVKELKGEISLKFIGGKDKKIKVLITSSEAVFPSEKQDIKPYVKGVNESEMPEMTELTSDNDEDAKRLIEGEEAANENPDQN